jgi:hypothetical protein
VRVAAAYQPRFCKEESIFSPRILTISVRCIDPNYGLFESLQSQVNNP